MSSRHVTCECLVPLYVTGKLQTTFLVHAIGGTVNFMIPVARRIASIRDVYGLQCYALDPRNTPDLTVQDMASRYWHAMREIQSSGPYEVVGYSMGGLIAVEIARIIAAAGDSLGLAVVVDTIAPSVPLSEINLADTLHLISLALGMSPVFYGDPAKSRADLINDFAASSARLTPHGGGLSLADIERLVGLYSINGSAANRYTPSSIKVPVSCLVTRGGEASRSISRWRELTAGKLRVEYLDADHFRLMHEANAGIVAEVLCRWIEDASRLERGHNLSGLSTGEASDAQ